VLNGRWAAPINHLPQRLSVTITPTNNVVAYVRVPSAGTESNPSSSQADHRRIERLARCRGLHITRWFDEKAFATKQDPVFGRMIKHLRNNDANGLIMNKGLRNLPEMFMLGKLQEQGTKVFLQYRFLSAADRSYPTSLS
jgi:hypothetical protein